MPNDHEPINQLFSIVAYSAIGGTAKSQGLALVYDEALARDIAQWRSTQCPAITYQVFNAATFDLVVSYRKGIAQ
jgi:hypothetical protein